MTTVSAAQQNVVTTHANATLYFAAISGESRYLTSTTFIHITIHGLIHWAGLNPWERHRI